MIGSRVVLKRKAPDEAEKPFWISFSDLMTALMVLFLVVMAISLLSITSSIRDADKGNKERQEAIALLLERLGQASQKVPGISIDANRYAVDLGERVRFAVNDHRIAQEGEDILREFVPDILNIASTIEGRRWIRRIVVEGFTDPDGTYLYNLDLSLKRAARVVCILLSDPTSPRQGLTADQKSQVRDLFLVGGYSFNDSKKSKDASRRVELRIDLRSLNDPASDDISVVTAPSSPDINFGRCPI